MDSAPTAPPRRMAAPVIDTLLRYSGFTTIFEEEHGSQPAPVPATSEQGGYPSAPRGAVHTDKEIKATLALQVAMFGEVSDGNLATAIGVNTPTAADRAFYSKHASEKLSAFFSATENNKFYNYVKATVKFHDYGVHIHNMRLACQQLPIRSPGETAGQTATREQLLAQYEASIRDHIARALAACDQYEEDLRNGAAAPVTGTGFTSLGKQNDKFVAAAIAVVAERARPFREAQHEVGDPAFTLADAAQPKLPYRLMEAVDRMKIWKCRFREGIFTFYRDAGQIDIVATVKRNPACGRYIIKQFAYYLDCLYMFIMATDIDRKAFQSTVTNPFVRGVDILDDLAGDFRAALRGFNRGFNTLNPLHRITSIGEYYVPSGGAGSKKKRKRGNESADPKVMSNGALAG